MQPPDGLDVAVAVDADESRPDERRALPETGLHRIRRHSQNQGQNPTADIERMVRTSASIENVIDHRFEDGVCLVTQQQFEDVDIGPLKSCDFPETFEPDRSPVRLHAVGRTPGSQSLVEAAQICRGDFPFIVASVPRFCATALPAGERNPVIFIFDPIDQLPGFGILAVNARGDVREVEGEQIFFVVGQHRTLRFGRMKRD